MTQVAHLLHEALYVFRMLCSSARGCSLFLQRIQFGGKVFQLFFISYKEAVRFGFAQLLCQQLLLPANARLEDGKPVE